MPLMTKYTIELPAALILDGQPSRKAGSVSRLPLSNAKKALRVLQRTTSW